MAREADLARERRIAELRAALLWTTDRLKAADIGRELQAEINARSPAQVARMELQKGLR